MMRKEKIFKKSGCGSGETKFCRLQMSAGKGLWLSAAKPAETKEIADGIGESQAEFLSIGGKIQFLDVGGSEGRFLFAEPAENTAGPKAEAGRFAGIGI
jgi:hypothetical protein